MLKCGGYMRAQMENIKSFRQYNIGSVRDNEGGKKMLKGASKGH